jgi:hypothetical protein
MTDSSQEHQSQCADDGALYEGHHLCPHLVPGQMCFRAKTYNEGVFETVFHEHVPSHRISQKSAKEVLRSLVARYSEWPGTFILRSHLNKQGHNPERYPGFTHHVSYPEPGAIRHTVSGPRVHAWNDSVLSKAAFRQSGTTPPEAKQ